MHRLLPLTLILAATCVSAGSPPRDLAKLLFADPHISDAQITPGNRGLSYQSDDGPYVSLRVYDFATGATAFARPEAGHSVYDHFWIDRESAIVLCQMRGAPTFAFATSYNLGRRVDTPITLVYDTMPDVNNLYLAKEGRVTDKFPDLYRVNAYTHSSVRVMENPGNVLMWYTDKDALPRIAYTVDEHERDQFDYRSAADEPWRRIDIRGEPFGAVFEGAGDTAILFMRKCGEERVAAYRFDAAKNEFLNTTLSDPVYDIIPSRIVIDPESEETLGFHYALAKPRSHWFNRELRAAQEQLDAARPDCVNQIAGFDHTGHGVVYQRFSDRDPGEWRIFDPRDSSDRLIDKVLPGVDPARMHPTEIVELSARDGATLHGYLTRPAKATGKAIVMIHGGPRSRDHWGWDPEAQYFAALGYAVLKLNYRGSEGYGTGYSPLYHLDSMESSVSDIIDATRWLVEEGAAEKGSIALYGSSFGGHVALRCAADAPDLYAAVVGYAGVYDWVQEIVADLKEEPEYYALKFKTYYGDFHNEKDKWLAASAISRVDRVRAPVFLIHGRADDVVSATQSRAMAKALRKAGVDTKLKQLSFNAHGLTIEKPRIQFYEMVAKFVEEALRK